MGFEEFLLIAVEDGRGVKSEDQHFLTLSAKVFSVVLRYVSSSPAQEAEEESSAVALERTATNFALSFLKLVIISWPISSGIGAIMGKYFFKPDKEGAGLIGRKELLAAGFFLFDKSSLNQAGQLLMDIGRVEV